MVPSFFLEKSLKFLARISTSFNNWFYLKCKTFPASMTREKTFLFTRVVVFKLLSPFSKCPRFSLIYVAVRIVQSEVFYPRVYMEWMSLKKLLSMYRFLSKDGENYQKKMIRCFCLCPWNLSGSAEFFIWAPEKNQFFCRFSTVNFLIINTKNPTQSHISRLAK